MTVFKICSIVLPERVIPGYVVVEDGLIAEIGFGESPYDGVDFHGDYLVPAISTYMCTEQLAILFT